MPIYEYENVETGEIVILRRSVDERNKAPKGFKRLEVQSSLGVVVGLPAPGFNDEFKRGCYDLECKNPDAWKKGTPKKDYVKALSLPDPPRGPGSDGNYGTGTNTNTPGVREYQRRFSKEALHKKALAASTVV